MVVRRHANAELAPIINLRSVVRNIPSEFGMSHDVKPGRDVRTAITGVPERNGPLRKISVLSHQNDLLARRRPVHEFRLNPSSHALADKAEQFLVRDTESLRQTPSLAVHIDHHAVAPAVEAADLREHSGGAGAVGKLAT
jgi:hypothetical protein